MSQGGVLSTTGGGGGGTITQLTGDDLLPVTPVAGNINLFGFGGIQTSNGGAATLDIEDRRWLSQYVVDPASAVGDRGTYTTIQAAVTAVSSGGVPAVIYLRPGTYTENIVFPDGIIVQIVSTGAAPTNDTIVDGVHTPPDSGQVTFANMTLTSSTHIYSSASAGSGVLIFRFISNFIANGYIFNLPNWAGGVFVLSDIFDNSTNNGIVNSPTNINILFMLQYASLTSSFTNIMDFGGLAFIENSIITTPISISAGGTLTANNCKFVSQLTFNNTANGLLYNCELIGGASPALTQSSSGTVSIYDSLIDSSNNPAISGAGVGVITLSNINFVNNTNIAGTLTFTKIGAQDIDVAYLNNVSFDRGTTIIDTDGQLIIGKTGSNPVISTISAGVGISVVNGPGSITIANTGSGAIPWTVISANQTLAVNNGYICDANTLSLALPATSAVGDIIEITVDGAISFSITQAAGQSIKFGAIASTAGVGGSVTSTVSGDSIRMVCHTANLRWIVLSSMGTFTVV